MSHAPSLLLCAFAPLREFILYQEDNSRWRRKGAKEESKGLSSISSFGVRIGF
jgi:hypothetical protein